MCLNLRRAYRTPYNKSKIRYKVVYVSSGGSLEPPYQCDVLSAYRKRGWNAARGFYNRQLEAGTKIRKSWLRYLGFHIFVSIKEAKKMITSHRAIYKVEVDGFLASGTFDTRRSETWRRMKFIKRIR